MEDAFDMEIAATPTSIGVARRALGAWADFLPDAQRTDLTIAASELLTNGVRHGPQGATITVHAHRTGGDLLVEVCDEGSDPSRIARSVPDALGGRGLMIVEKIASDWGVLGNPTCVWFRLGPERLAVR